jgi:hypothetical protein
MFDRIGRSYRLFKESLAVLRQDKEILVFPLLSGLVGLVAMASMTFGGWALGLFAQLAGGSGEKTPVLGYVLLFVWYVVTWTITLYFNVATIACARIRLEGGDPVVADGFRAANGNLTSILVWAVVSATVGLVLQVIADRFKFVGVILQKVLGAVWSVATFFIVPVLIFEKKPLGDSVKRSTEIVRKSWGEALAGSAGMGLFGFLLALPALALPILLGMAAGGTGVVVGLVVMIVYWLFLATVFSALSGIFRTALYLYATAGTPPAGFSPELVKTAFVPQ